MPRSLQELRQLSIDEYLLDCKPFATLSSDERILYPDIAGSLRCLGLEGDRVDDDITAEVKKRYKKLALVWHPDKGSEDSRFFQELSSAYKVLTDPDDFSVTLLIGSFDKRLEFNDGEKFLTFGKSDLPSDLEVPYKELIADTALRFEMQGNDKLLVTSLSEDILIFTGCIVGVLTESYIIRKGASCLVTSDGALIAPSVVSGESVAPIVSLFVKGLKGPLSTDDHPRVNIYLNAMWVFILIPLLLWRFGFRCCKPKQATSATSNVL